MALPSRLGAFMVGTAFGAAQGFYWLYHDVQAVQAALSRKMDAVHLHIVDQAQNADLRLAAVKDAIPGLSIPPPTTPTPSEPVPPECSAVGSTNTDTDKSLITKDKESDTNSTSG